MDRLITHNGGMPLELDDLIFIQDAFKGALKGLLHEFVRANFGNVILSGCKITDLGGGSYTLSEGYVMLDYEVFYVPALTTSFVISVLIVDVNYDPAGNDQFFDGVSRNTYEKRTATPWDTTITLPSIRVLVSDENRLTHLMPEAMKGNWALTDFVGEKYVFQTADFKNGATASAAFPPYAIKKNGVVRFYGVVDIPSGISSSTDILEVPVSFRKGISFGGVYLCSCGASVVRLGVGASNLTYLDTSTVRAGIDNDLSLNQISYDIDNI